MHESLPSRRGVLKFAGLAAAALAAPGVAARALAVPARRTAGVLRIAHMTDLHIQPERRAAEGVANCFRAVMGEDSPPRMILTGGDLIMDGFEQPRERTALQFDLLTKALKDVSGARVEHCLGNHDIWGWNRKKSGTSGNEQGWGKAWACDALGLAKPYRSFDEGGWHFIVLDTVQPDGDGYKGGVDDEQLEWLKSDLAHAAGKKVAVLSHIPVLSVVAMAGYKVEGGQFRFGQGSMVTNGRDLHLLFRKHGGVKLCISGHIHRLEKIELDGVTYVCGGAVSGAWWKGPADRCDEGYSLFDLHEDGRVDWKYRTYGWRAEA